MMKVTYTRVQVFIEGVAFLILAATTVFVLSSWGSIPDVIPGHYNAVGAIDRWTGKASLYFLIGVDWLLYLILTVAGFFPKSWNMPVKPAEEDMPKVYSIVLTMLLALKLVMVLIFSYLIYNTMRAQPLAGWALPVVLVCIFGTMAAFTLYISIKYKKRSPR